MQENTLYFQKAYQYMDIDDEETDASTETGSDELLADDHLRLPDSANMLVRIHAVRAWLTRRQQEATLEIGEAALALQEAMHTDLQETRPRRRHMQAQQERITHAQHILATAQQRVSAYEEAQELLEECIAHTNGERVLVEYYLTLEGLVQHYTREEPPDSDEHQDRKVWLETIATVQHRIERVGTPNEL